MFDIFVRTFQSWKDNRNVAELTKLSPRQQMDLGLTSLDIEKLVGRSRTTHRT
ncbi:hypothetical protein [Amorphus orientalis]|uniref:Uncharacterized protein YjiS (DUF1127 family) n=1 Tax=Amorphus orientalis TaxID=649198 RepID=A0AAE3VPL0_9HYPH|nr:hypothetical protein [Amorphus orientalis]MDQ0315830.1 uncharacterized protein YjiS (DUF1127 family) [Amorphus orientalis]